MEYVYMYTSYMYVYESETLMMMNLCVKTRGPKMVTKSQLTSRAPGPGQAPGPGPRRWGRKALWIGALHTNVNMYIYIHMCIHIYIYICVHEHIYIYIYIPEASVQ